MVLALGLLRLTLLRSVSVNLAELWRAPAAGGGDVEMFESVKVGMSFCISKLR